MLADICRNGGYASFSPPLGDFADLFTEVTPPFEEKVFAELLRRSLDQDIPMQDLQVTGPSINQLYAILIHLVKQNLISCMLATALLRLSPHNPSGMYTYF